VQDALANAERRKDVALVGIATGREREHAGEAGAVEHEGRGGDARGLGMAVEVIVEEVLDTLIDGAEMARENAVFFAADREKMVDERREAVGRAGGKGHAGLTDLAELQIEVGEELAVGVDRSGGGGEGRHE
jgi:hypothetical protein